MATRALNYLRPVLRNNCTIGSRHISPIKTWARYSSHSPMGSTTTNTRKKVTIQTIQSLYKKNEPITVLTASDFPSGHVADSAGMEIVLVGDSLAMVAMGMEDTNEVTMEEMLLHCRSVNRAVKSAFTVSTHMHTINRKHANISNPHPRSQIYPWAHTRYPQSKR
jgi:3-methyl-2-oxobutanoate hydroxymethyltransferase